MSSGFQLPTFDSAIPGTVVPASGRKRAARLALRLLDAGVIPETAPGRLASDPLNTCQRHLQEWLDARLGGLHCLRMGFRLGLCKRSFYGEATPSGDEYAYFVWFASPEPFIVGPALEQLESMHSGLGATILSLLESSIQLAPIFTPAEVLYTAREYFWQGEEDETRALDDQVGDDDPAEREALREQMVTRALIDAAFPPWALAWRAKRKLVGTATLRRLATTARSPRVRGVLADAAALAALKLDQRFQPDGDGHFVGYAGVLMWREGDVASRVFDDFMNDAMQGDAYDAIGEATFGLADAEPAREWLDGLEPYLHGIRRLDHLMHELCTGDWRRIARGFR